MKDQPDFHCHFLVSCLGAYADSGLGTGGFVVVHEGESVVLDKIDSTGLCRSGPTIYRFARGLRAIVAYQKSGLRFVLKLSEAADVHDILLHDRLFVCASTGTNEVLWIDSLDGVVRRWQADGKGDAWHLNGLCRVEGRLHISAFGRFPTHRGWVGGCAGRGFVFDLEKQCDVISGLNGPHNPRCIDGLWVVCDSHANALVLQEPGKDPCRLPLGGFTRGLAWDDTFFYVGESANRKAAVPADYSSIAVISRATREVVARIPVPFPEIYEISIVSASRTEAMVAKPGDYQIDQASERFAALENQVALGWREIDELKRRLGALRPYEQLRARAIDFKRWLVG